MGENRRPVEAVAHARRGSALVRLVSAHSYGGCSRREGIKSIAATELHAIRRVLPVEHVLPSE